MFREQGTNNHSSYHPDNCFLMMGSIVDICLTIFVVDHMISRLIRDFDIVRTLGMLTGYGCILRFFIDVESFWMIFYKTYR